MENSFFITNVSKIYVLNIVVVLLDDTSGKQKQKTKLHSYCHSSLNKSSPYAFEETATVCDYQRFNRIARFKEKKRREGWMDIENYHQQQTKPEDGSNLQTARFEHDVESFKSLYIN